MGGDLHGQPGEQGGHAGDIAVVLAGLVGAAEDDLVDGVGGDAGLPLEQCPEDVRGEVVGTDAGQGAAVATDRRADAVDEMDGRGDHGGS